MRSAPPKHAEWLRTATSRCSRSRAGACSSATRISPLSRSSVCEICCYQAMRSRIEPMKKIARTLRAHRALLLNYFKAKKQFSSGVVEGLNNKAKVTMRRSYGFRTFRVLELALYHSLAKLPEPELTHEFF